MTEKAAEAGGALEFYTSLFGAGVTPEEIKRRFQTEQREGVGS